MYARLAVALLAGTALVGCGSSITDVTPRSAGPTTARAALLPCDAVEQSQVATEPVTRWRTGQRVDDVGEVAARVRTANQQVSALAPPELRADVDLVTGVVDRQLRLLEDSGGDTMALARDPDVGRTTGDPGYRAASGRISDYVRRTC